MGTIATTGTGKGKGSSQTSSTRELKSLDDSVNQLILNGKALEALEQFYDKNVAMQENDEPPTVGLDANREREKQLFGSVEQFYGADMLAQGVGDGVTFTEWKYDWQLKGSPRSVLHEVSERKWKDGKIVQERFFHK